MGTLSGGGSVFGFHFQFAQPSAGSCATLTKSLAYIKPSFGSPAPPFFFLRIVFPVK